MKPLKIGIDVHSIGSQKGGNETYYRELIRNLVNVPCDHKFFLYYTAQAAVEQISVNDRCFLQQLLPANPLLRIPFVFPRRSRRDSLDVFHAQFIVPPFLKCRTVTTIPDIAYEHYPQAFPFHQRAALKILVRHSAERADHIITVSEFSKKDIAETYHVSPSKISVIYEGAGNEFAPIEKEIAGEQVASKFGIEGPFILYLGRLQARKNLARLVQAFAHARKAGFPHKLVLAGKQDSLFDAVLSHIHELELDDHVILTGYVPDQDVPKLYSAATVFIYPSLFEGFGLPVLEAMACGAPVITSHGSSLEEVAGDAAVLIDPLDELAIAEALKRVLGDAGLQSRLSQAGLARSRKFSFRNAARQTVAVYEQVMGEV